MSLDCFLYCKNIKVLVPHYIQTSSSTTTKTHRILTPQGGAIIRQLRRNVENIGFDMETGLLLPHRPKPLPEISDNKIIKEGEKLVVETQTD